jgi:hypothetical protein
MRRVLVACAPALVLSLVLLAAVLVLTGCKGASPCFGHGFVVSYSGSWANCSDGTRQPVN